MKQKAYKFCILLSLILSMLFSSTAFAQTSTPAQKKLLKDLKINYTTMLGHEGRSYGKLLQEMLNNGLTKEDADYYAKMDILSNQIELQNIDVNASLKDVQKFSNEYTRVNPDEVRNLALNLDPKALKTLLSQNDAFIEEKDSEQETIKELNDKGYDVTVEYSDGSKVIMSSTTNLDQANNSELYTNTNVIGPWTTSYMFNFDLNARQPGGYVSRSSWTYLSGVSYAKVEDVFSWSLGSDYNTVRYTSDTGAASYAGVVSIDLEYLSNNIGTLAGPHEYIAGYTDVRFTVSGSFSAELSPVLSISVNGGAGWHQYCINEVDNIGGVRYWAAQFK